MQSAAFHFLARTCWSSNPKSLITGAESGYFSLIVFRNCSIHGLGLATKLQEFTLSQDGLVANIVSFNVGVEIGQMLALTGVFIVLSYWRTRKGYLEHAFLTNSALMAGGFILMGYQIVGYFAGA